MLGLKNFNPFNKHEPDMRIATPNKKTNQNCFVNIGILVVENDGIDTMYNPTSRNKTLATQTSIIYAQINEEVGFLIIGDE